MHCKDMHFTKQKLELILTTFTGFPVRTGETSVNRAGFCPKPARNSENDSNLTEILLISVKCDEDYCCDIRICGCG